MKPYYDCDGITIYHGDCREVLPQLPDADAIITDPVWLNAGALAHLAGADRAQELLAETAFLNETRPRHH